MRNSAICFVLAGLLLPAFAAPSAGDNPTALPAAARSGLLKASLPSNPLESTPELQALRAELAVATASGDVVRIKSVHSRIQALYLAAQGPQEATVTAELLPDPPPASCDVGADIVIQGGPVYGTAADYLMDGTMYAAASLPDSSVRIWRSIDHGETWQYFSGVMPSPHAIYGRIQLVAADGDSDFVFVFLIHPSGSGDVYVARFDTSGTTLVFRPVKTGGDTINDISFCRDFDNYYYVYGLGCDSTKTSRTSILRSNNHGIDWAVTDDWVPLDQPAYQHGAGRWQYVAIRVPYWGPGHFACMINPNYGDPTEWVEYDFYYDTLVVEEPVVSPAFTKPESTAVLWVAWHRINGSGSPSPVSLLTSYSTDGGNTFAFPQVMPSETGAGDVYPDLKNYRSLGNTYINLSYVSLYNGYRRLFRRFANAPTPGNWSDTLRLNSEEAFRSHPLKPLLVYSPGAPGTGAGAVFVHYNGAMDYVWNAPWNTVGVSERGQPAAPVRVRLAPNPAARRARVSWPGPAAAVTVYGRDGRLVRRFATPGSPLDWNLTDAGGRRVAPGVYVVRLGDGQPETAKLVVE